MYLRLAATKTCQGILTKINLLSTKTKLIYQNKLTLIGKSGSKIGLKNLMHLV
jgi:hypothetical protein